MLRESHRSNSQKFIYNGYGREYHFSNLKRLNLLSQEVKEVKPQTRYDNVNPEDIEKVMANIKKGVVRR